jgi:hypothetical protein
VSLKPQNLVQAAEADLRRREWNKRVFELRLANAQSGTPYDEEMQEYAFLARHVRRAKSARQLMILALMDYGCLAPDEETEVIGPPTTKRNTRLIYGNGALLVAAIRLLAVHVSEIGHWPEQKMKRKIERTYDLEPAEVRKAIHWYLARIKDWPMPEDEKKSELDVNSDGSVTLKFTEEIEEKDE